MYECAPCRKAFSHAGELAAHRSAHERCAFPGCGFEASKRVVVEHSEPSGAVPPVVVHATSASSNRALCTHEAAAKVDL